MKYLFLILLSLPVFANRVPLSEAQRYIEAAPNGVPALFTCEQRPEEPCLEFSHIEGWDVAEIEVKEDEKGGKTYALKNSEAKIKAKADKEKLEKAEKAAKAKIKEDALKVVKSYDPSKVTNIDELKGVVDKLIIALEMK